MTKEKAPVPIHTMWWDLPSFVRDDFWEWFEDVHDEEEEWAAPGSVPCGEDEDCCDKIGQERMEELFQLFLAEQPPWVRQLANTWEEEPEY